MFDRIRKVLQREGRGPEATASQLGHGPMSAWAASRGMTITGAAPGKGTSMQGKVDGHAWRMEIGRPTRDYIQGEELRARAELGLFEDVGAMIINRPLKDKLERRAYSMITDTLQTTADPRLPEEMRWLALYDEIGWEGVPNAFWKRCAVLADKREHALAWVDDTLVDLILRWPEPAPAPEVPFMLVLLRGRCYLRMQFEPPLTDTLEHAAEVFTAACGAAIGAFGSGQ